MGSGALRAELAQGPQSAAGIPRIPGQNPASDRVVPLLVPWHGPQDKVRTPQWAARPVAPSQPPCLHTLDYWGHRGFSEAFSHSICLQVSEERCLPQEAGSNHPDYTWNLLQAPQPHASLFPCT